MKLLRTAGIFLSLFAVGSAAFAKGKPFELYPSATGAPVTFSKSALPFEGKWQAWKAASGPKVTLKVDATKVLRTLNPYQFGNNTSWWSGKGWFLDPDRLEKARQSGIRFWRWPGGSSSDNYFWDGDYSSHPKDHEGNDPSNMNKPGMVSTDDFIEFCRATGSEPIITVNYGDARYNSVQHAADLAARWVHYCNVEKGFKVRYWEVGNEVYGDWEENNNVEGKERVSGDIYGKDFGIIADAMRKVDPSIFVGAVAVDEDAGEASKGFFWWMRDLLPQLKGKADYLILHQYFMWPYKGKEYTHPSSEVLFGNLSKLGEGMNATREMIEKYAPLEKGIPVALTEFNLLNADPPETIELINGIFTAEVLGESLKSGYVATNYWDWKNGLDKEGGDMAMLASKDPSVPDATPRPSYYAHALFARAFGDRLIECESSDPSVKVYASRFAGGQLGLIIVNEDGNGRILNFDLKGFMPKGRLTGWVLGGKNINEKQVTWNGEPGPVGGGGPFPLDTIPPYRAAYDPATPLQLPIQPGSVTGIILY